VRAVDVNRDVRRQMHRARSRLRAALPQPARQFGDRRPSGRLAECRVPGAVLGEQLRHPVKPTLVQAEAVFRQHFPNCILVFYRCGHRYFLRHLALRRT